MMNLIEKLKENTKGIIIIGPNETKSLFLSLRKKEPLINFKFFTVKDIQKELFFNLGDKEILTLMKEEHLTYNLAKKYISFINRGYEGDDELINKIKNRFIDKKVDNAVFKLLFLNKKVYFISYVKEDQEIKHLIDKLNLNDYEFLKLNDYVDESKKPTYFKFKSIDEEVKYALNLIAQDLENGKKVNVICNYQKFGFYLNSFADLIGLKLNSNSNISLYDTEVSKDLFKHLESGSNETLIDYFNKKTTESESLKKDEFQPILDLIKTFDIDNLEDKKINLKQILQGFYLKESKFINGIPVSSSIEFDDNTSYYLLGVEDGFFPNISSDDDKLTDINKEKGRLSTSDNINKARLDYYRYFLYQTNLTFISFHQFEVGGGNPSLPFLFIANKIEDKKPEFLNIEYSKDLATTFYSDYQSFFNKYKEKKDGFNSYTKSLNLPEKFDNKFNGTKIKVNYNYPYSISLISEYYECPFKFYLDKILKLGVNEYSFPLFYGKFAHTIFENVFSKKVSFEDAYQKAMIEYKETFLKRDLFFVEGRKDMLKEAFDSVRNRFNLQNITKIEKEWPYTFKIPEIDKEFMGIIDCLVEVDNKYLYVVDYKTGKARFDDATIEYGTKNSIQLPGYYYLLKNVDEFKDKEVVGLYIQQLQSSYSYKDNKYDQNQYLLHGYTLNDKDVVYALDNSLVNNQISLVLENKDGNLENDAMQNISNLVDSDKFNSYYDTVKDLIINFNNNFNEANFDISPYYIDDFDNACQYCPFSNICYKKQENVRNLMDEKENQNEDDDDDEEDDE